MTTAPPLAPRKLPVWSAVAACYTIVLGNLGQLLRIAWLLLLIMVPVYAAAYWLAWPWSPQGGEPAEGLAGSFFFILPNLVELPFLASIAVAWHRLLLRGERVEDARYFRFDRTVWRYAGLSLALLLVCGGPAYFLPSLPYEGAAQVALSLTTIILAMGLLLLVMPRLSVALPGVALGEEAGLAQVWRATQGNTWRLTLATMLCLLPVVLLLVPISIFEDPTSRALSVLTGTVGSLLNAVLVTLAVTLLSVSYRVLVRGEAVGAPARD